MIAFGAAVTDRATYERIALPGIRRAAEPDSAILTRHDRDSIQRPYNEMLDEAAALPGLEALVLPHQDVELLDDSLPERVRQVFADPQVGLVGPLGGVGSKAHCWLWPERGYGTMNPGLRPPVAGSQEVDALDGALLVLAPWVVRTLRFDERLAECFHGYDVDIALRVAAHGGKVICRDIPARHRRQPRDEHEAQRVAGVALARMWDPSIRPREWQAAFQP